MIQHPALNGINVITEELRLTGFIKQTLPELIKTLPGLVISSSELPAVPVTGITDDSRDVRTDTLFVAYKGGSSDGHRYIPQAIAQGAAAVIGTDPMNDLTVPYIQVQDARLALALLVAAFYGNPARGLTMIGVTGTDGKTTTSNLIYHILLHAGKPAGIISTVNAMIGSEVVDTGFHVTTPPATDVQRYLTRMRAAGLTHVVLEATSHGLSQHRVAGCEFDIGLITNITHEHLDYHGSFESYRDAKASLLTGLAGTAPKEMGVPPLAVLNRDEPTYPEVSKLVTVRQVSYSLSPDSGADVWAEEIGHDAEGLHFVAVGPGFREPVRCSLIGFYNVSNCLGALCVTVLGLGIDAATACAGLGKLSGVPGRMEQINMGQSFMAIVDFAHTPNALKHALQTARQMTSGRVISVFGSAGLRDREKRRMMAQIAAEGADVSILTAEDPRTESLDDILAEMANGACSRGGVEGQTFIRVRDRGEAIRQAVRMARPGDVVIACGKGHEQSMCFGQQEYPWDDRVAMRAALAELLSATGPHMPYLPTQDE
jgi:UDP-N-acetylmuramoyl-L-alanyl-D-glutamate--2,6-diaminopimelate ligase